VRTMRRISGSFWTPERDERLRRLEAEGLSAAKIGEKLGTTRGAVLGRLHRLSGAALTYPSYIRQEKEARARAAARMKERKRAESTVIPRMQQEIMRGVGRNRAIAKARKAGATLRAIGDAVGISKELVRQIVASCERKKRPAYKRGFAMQAPTGVVSTLRRCVEDQLCEARLAVLASRTCDARRATYYGTSTPSWDTSTSTSGPRSTA
jgi:GcrA cell cycle regulator